MKFVLDCEQVQAASEEINNLGLQMEEIANAIASYATANPDFDFDTPKQAIFTNVNGASIKIKNTSNLMNKVIDSHTALQTSMVYEPGMAMNSSSFVTTASSTASSTGIAKANSASTAGANGSSSSASARNVSAAAMAAGAGSLLATNAAMGASAEAKGMTKVASIRNGQVEILDGYEGMFTEEDILKMATKEIIEVPEGLGKVHS